MSKSFRRAAILSSAAAVIAPFSATAADDAGEDRDYLPRSIIVTGEKQGYGEDDGSSGTKTPTPLIE